MQKALSTEEKQMLTKSVNKALELKESAKELEKVLEELTEVIRPLLERAGNLWETEKALARLIERGNRNFDLEKIQKIVDKKDLEFIAPRKVVAKNFDEVIGHHRYEDLERAMNIKKTTILEIKSI